jgi:hypothetical protein
MNDELLQIEDEIRALSERLGALARRVALLRGAPTEVAGDVLEATESVPVAVGEARTVDALARPAVSLEGIPEPELDDQGVPAPGPWTTTGEVLTEAFRAALYEEEERAFLHYCRLFHSEMVRAPQAMTNLKIFQWKQLRRGFAQYLTRADDPGSFRIERQVPSEPKDSDAVLKIFIRSSKRLPVPTIFRRDPALGGLWRIETSSL